MDQNCSSAPQAPSATNLPRARPRSPGLAPRAAIPTRSRGGCVLSHCSFDEAHESDTMLSLEPLTPSGKDTDVRALPRSLSQHPVHRRSALRGRRGRMHRFNQREEEFVRLFELRHHRRPGHHHWDDHSSGRSETPDPSPCRRAPPHHHLGLAPGTTNGESRTGSRRVQRSGRSPPPR